MRDWRGNKWYIFIFCYVIKMILILNLVLNFYFFTSCLLPPFLICPGIVIVTDSCCGDGSGDWSGDLSGACQAILICGGCGIGSRVHDGNAFGDDGYWIFRGDVNLICCGDETLDFLSLKRKRTLIHTQHKPIIFDNTPFLSSRLLKILPLAHPAQNHQHGLCWCGLCHRFIEDRTPFCGPCLSGGKPTWCSPWSCQVDRFWFFAKKWQVFFLSGGA